MGRSQCSCSTAAGTKFLRLLFAVLVGSCATGRGGGGGGGGGGAQAFLPRSQRRTVRSATARRFESSFVRSHASGFLGDVSWTTSTVALPREGCFERGQRRSRGTISAGLFGNLKRRLQRGKAKKNQEASNKAGSGAASSSSGSVLTGRQVAGGEEQEEEKVEKKQLANRTPWAATQVAVVGAGVSGLVCARKLAAEGLDVVVLEASDGVGGRVRTDVHEEGYLLDRGFQVFIEEYPSVKAELNYTSLGLSQFRPGALVQVDGGLHNVADPFRRPQDIVAGLIAPVGSLLDKVKVGLYRIAAAQNSKTKIFEYPERRTYDFLSKDLGLSDAMIDRFFRPFYQGIYLAPLEKQSSRMFEFVFCMFAKGAASLPEGGLQAVPAQIAASLEEIWAQQRASSNSKTDGGVCETTRGLHLNSPVRSVDTGRVVLSDGRELTCDHVVVATDGPAASRLFAKSHGGGNDETPLVRAPVDRSSTCLYFAIDGPPPVPDPILVLNGNKATRDRPVNNVCFPSVVQPGYAPENKTLASVTVVDACADIESDVTDSVLAERCKAHLKEWFDDVDGNDNTGSSATGKSSEENRVSPSSVDSWHFLRAYRIAHSQPGQDPADEPNRTTFEKHPEVFDGVFCCGDHRSTATLNGAFESGFNTARIISSRYTGRGRKLLSTARTAALKERAITEMVE